LTPDPQAIADFAGLLFVPAPHTIHRGISALTPGEIIDCQLENDERVTAARRRFHEFTSEPDQDLTLDQALDDVDTLVEKAVVRGRPDRGGDAAAREGGAVGRRRRRGLRRIRRLLAACGDQRAAVGPSGRLARWCALRRAACSPRRRAADAGPQNARPGGGRQHRHPADLLFVARRARTPGAYSPTRRRRAAAPPFRAPLASLGPPKHRAAGTARSTCSRAQS